MAHYAFVVPHPTDENIKVVVKTITGVDEDDTSTLPDGFANWEAFYSNQQGMECLRYSYNTKGGVHREGGTPFRGNSAGNSDWYDIENDVFYGEKPFESWILNETTWEWEPPIAHPSTGPACLWDEELHQGDSADPKTLGWVAPTL